MSASGFLRPKGNPMTTISKQKSSVAKRIIDTHEAAHQRARKSMKRLEEREQKAFAISSDIIYMGRNFGPANAQTIQLIEAHRAATTRLTAALEADPSGDGTEVKAAQRAQMMAALNIAAQDGGTNADRAAVMAYTEEANDEDLTALQGLVCTDIPVFRNAYARYCEKHAAAPRVDGCKIDPTTGRTNYISGDWDVGIVSEAALKLIAQFKAADARYVVAIKAENDRDPTPEEQAEIDAAHEDLCFTAAACSTFRGSRADTFAMSDAAESVDNDFLTHLMALPFTLRDAVGRAYAGEHAAAELSDEAKAKAAEIKVMQDLIVEYDHWARVSDAFQDTLNNHYALANTDRFGEPHEAADRYKDRVLDQILDAKCLDRDLSAIRVDFLIKRDLVDMVAELAGYYIRKEKASTAAPPAPTSAGVNAPAHSRLDNIAAIISEYKAASAVQDAMEAARDELPEGERARLKPELDEAEARVSAAVQALVNYRPETIEEVRERMKFITTDESVENLFDWQGGTFGAMLLKSMA